MDTDFKRIRHELRANIADPTLRKRVLTCLEISERMVRHQDVYWMSGRALPPGSKLEDYQQWYSLVDHLLGVTDVSLCLCDALGSTRTERAIICAGAFLHDVGKPYGEMTRGNQDWRLNREFNPKEKQGKRDHTTAGDRFLTVVGDAYKDHHVFAAFYNEIKAIVRNHDQPKTVPQAIVCFADLYRALRETRGSRQSFTHSEAMEKVGFELTIAEWRWDFMTEDISRTIISALNRMYSPPGKESFESTLHPRILSADELHKKVREFLKEKPPLKVFAKAF